MIAIDTNLLVYAHRAATRQHKAARKAIQKAASSSGGWGIALPCLAEFWSVVTHPTCSGGPSTVNQARNFLENLLRSGSGQIWLPSADLAEQLMEVAEEMKIQGTRIFDLQIAVIASGNGATEIWTHDADFLSVSGLKVYDPL